MSTKIVIFQLVKEEVKPEFLPILEDEIRKLTQLYLFQILRESYDKCEKLLKTKTAESLAALSQYPELHFWKNLSDKELFEYIQSKTEEEDVRGGGGWKYTIIDDPICVSSILKLRIVGQKVKLPIKSWFQIPDWQGLRISEEVRND